MQETSSDIGVSALFIPRLKSFRRSVQSTAIIIKWIRVSRPPVGKKPPSVDEYISAAPRSTQAKLREVRLAILEAAPEAKESISYGMAYYNYKGRLAWFGLHTSHIGLYLRPPVVEEHEKDLEGYETTKSAVHLPLDKKIPVSLVKKLVKARMKMNDARPEGRP